MHVVGEDYRHPTPVAHSVYLLYVTGPTCAASDEINICEPHERRLGVSGPCLSTLLRHYDGGVFEYGNVICTCQLSFLQQSY